MSGNMVKCHPKGAMPQATLLQRGDISPCHPTCKVTIYIYTSFIGGAKQNQQPNIDPVKQFFSNHWLTELVPVQQVVRQMLSYNPADRPRQVSHQLKDLYPDDIQKVEEWHSYTPEPVATASEYICSSSFLCYL